MHTRYLLALTGPSGVGKSTLSRLVVHACGDACAQVPILTTRDPKAGDDGEYRHVTVEAFCGMRDRGLLAAAVRIPSMTEERWYGYAHADIEAVWARHRLPLVITEMRLLEQLAAGYGRRSVLSLGLLPPGKSRRSMLSHLLHRLRRRGRETPAQIVERLRNAEDDLRFFQDRSDLFNAFIVNDDLALAVEHIRAQVPSLRQSATL